VEIRDIVPLDEREKGRTLWRPWRAHCEREEGRRRWRARGEREGGEEAAAAVANGPWHGAEGKEGKEKSQRVRGQVCESSGGKKISFGQKHPLSPNSLFL